MGTFFEISVLPVVLCLGLGAGKRLLDAFVRPGWEEGLSELAELSTLWMGYVWLSNFTGRWAIGCLDEGDIINVLGLGVVVLFVTLFGGRAGRFDA
ncbi:MAG: hypothetical protein HPY67_16505 [Syntrophaceae bacterium]|nr:hypothetical protein [Syntrophaceae bacterium]